MKVKSLSGVWLFVTPWTVAYQASLSMGFSRKEYWSGLPFPSPGDLSNPGIEPRSPALEAAALPSELQFYRFHLILCSRNPEMKLQYLCPEWNKPPDMQDQVLCHQVQVINSEHVFFPDQFNFSAFDVHSF